MSRFAVLMAGSVFLLIALAVTAEEPTGIEVGKNLPGSFQPYNVNVAVPLAEEPEPDPKDKGEKRPKYTSKGKFHCLVSEYDLDPVVMLVARGLDIEGLTAPLLVFEGSAREAIKGFPANVNVAVALALAGIGPDRTRVAIWADPGVTRNTHTIEVISDTSNFTMTIAGLPSAQTPATGRIVPLSVIATLRRLTAPLVIGT